MPLGTEVSLGPGDIVLDGGSALHMSIVAKRSPISATAELVYFCHVLTFLMFS